MADASIEKTVVATVRLSHDEVATIKIALGKSAGPLLADVVELYEFFKELGDDMR
jgi:hypothetical protein